MVKVSDIIKIIERLAPLALKQDYDNVGLLVGSRDMPAAKIMCCLDVTDSVINEAVKAKIDLIISHHPLIFNSVMTVTDDTVLGGKLLKLIRNNIAVYSAHTNLDFCDGGINDYVADIIGLTAIEPLFDNDSANPGRIGYLTDKISLDKLRLKIAASINDKYVSIIGDKERTIKSVIVVNGSGGGDTKIIDRAVELRADCVFTAEVKHHVAAYALDCCIAIIEAQHSCMEHCYITKLVKIIKEHQPQAQILQSKSDISIIRS